MVQVGYTRQLLPTITTAELQAQSLVYCWPANCCVRISRPEDGLVGSVHKGIQSWWSGDGVEESLEGIQALLESAEFDMDTLPAWSEEMLPSTLRDTGGFPEEGRIIDARSTDPGEALEEEVKSGVLVDGKYLPQVEEMELSNGMRVALYPTKHLDDDIRFKAHAFGGLSEVDWSEQPAAMQAVNIVEELGVFGVLPEVFLDMMAGRRIALGADINVYSRTITGASSIDLPRTECEVIQVTVDVTTWT